ncbi:MAG: PilZ domain-containing protein [Candidatus Eisenbacteria bacterium]
MTWDGVTDRRRHKRAAIRLQSEFGDPVSPTRIETVDFSAGGFSCWMGRAVRPLTRLALRFDFPAFAEETPRTIECEGIVVRCEKRPDGVLPWSMAAAFTSLRPADRDFLERYIDWHETVMSPDPDESFSDAVEGPGD